MKKRGDLMKIARERVRRTFRFWTLHHLHHQFHFLYNKQEDWRWFFSLLFSVRIFNNGGENNKNDDNGTATRGAHRARGKKRENCFWLVTCLLLSFFSLDSMLASVREERVCVCVFRSFSSDNKISVVIIDKQRTKRNETNKINALLVNW